MLATRGVLFWQEMDQKIFKKLYYNRFTWLLVLVFVVYEQIAE